MLLFLIWRYSKIAGLEHVINEEITAAQIRVVDSESNQLGIMTPKEALHIAEQRGMDLVLIAPLATPPVCRIMDYGKFRFEQQKRAKDQRKNQKVVELKEIWLSLNIGEHDFNTKVGHAVRFLQGGDKVKASIRFRGREMAHAALGNVTMDKFAAALTEIATVEKPSKLEGRSMTMILAPKISSTNLKGKKQDAED